MGAFQSVPVELAGLLGTWGLDAETLATLALLITMTVELVKKHMAVSGKNLLLVSLGSGLAWCTLFFAPNWLMVLRTGVMSALAASGGFQMVKTIAGKVGEDKFEKFGKPPSTLTDVKPGN